MSQILREIIKEFEIIRKQKMKLYAYEKLIIICFFLVCGVAAVTSVLDSYLLCPEWMGQISAWGIIGAVALLVVMFVCVNKEQRPQFNEQDLKEINEILKGHGINNKEERLLLKEMIMNSGKGKQYHPIGTRLAFDLLIVPIFATLVGSFVEDGWLIKFEAGKLITGAGMELYLTIILIVSLCVGIVNICNIIGGKGKAVQIDFVKAIDEINCWEKIVHNTKK